MILNRGLRRRKLSAGVSFINYSTSIFDTIVIPANSQVGDIALLGDFVGNLFVTVTRLSPSGWTQLASNGSLSRTGLTVSYKILTSGQPGSTITGQNGFINSKVMLIFRLNSGSITSVATPYNQITCSTGNPTDHTVPVATQPCIVAAFNASEATPASWASTSPTPDQDYTAVYIRGSSWLNPQQSVAVTMNDLGAHNEFWAGSLELS